MLKQRLDKPYKRENGKLVESNWDEVIEIVCSKINEIEDNKIAAHIGDMQSMETIHSLKSLLKNIGVTNYEFREKPFYINSNNKINYIFNSSINGIEEADCIILIGSNPRHEATMVNARIRKTFVSKKIPILSFGNPGDLTYEYKIVGNTVEDIEKFIKNENEASKLVLNSKKPMIIIGESALELASGKFIFEGIKNFLIKNNFINENWNALNVLIQNASTVGALDLGFFNSKNNNTLDFFNKLNNNEFKLLYFVGSDNINFVKKEEFVIYQGSHGDRTAQIADIILPSPAFTEQNGLFLNLEGRLQRSVKSSYPPGDSKEDWKIFNLIIKKLANQDLFKSFKQLRESTLKEVKNHSEFDLLPDTKVDKKVNEIGNMKNENIFVKEIDYYFSNSIARSSKTMSDCRSARFKSKIAS